MTPGWCLCSVSTCVYVCVSTHTRIRGKQSNHALNLSLVNQKGYFDLLLTPLKSPLAPDMYTSGKPPPYPRARRRRPHQPHHVLPRSPARLGSGRLGYIYTRCYVYCYTLPTYHHPAAPRLHTTRWSVCLLGSGGAAGRQEPRERDLGGRRGGGLDRDSLGHLEAGLGLVCVEGGWGSRRPLMVAPRTCRHA
jgi:hypothetical protein